MDGCTLSQVFARPFGGIWTTILSDAVFCRGGQSLGRDPWTPTWQHRCVAQIYAHLRGDEQRVLDLVEGIDVPAWWRPGLPARTTSDAQRSHLATSLDEGATEPLSVELGAEDADGPEPVNAKRRKIHVLPAAVQWFLTFSEHMRQTPRSCSFSRCVKFASKLCLEIFGAQTPRR